VTLNGTDVAEMSIQESSMVSQCFKKCILLFNTEVATLRSEKGPPVFLNKVRLDLMRDNTTLCYLMILSHTEYLYFSMINRLLRKGSHPTEEGATCDGQVCDAIFDLSISQTLG
jgi:hypothetical protein